MNRTQTILGRLYGFAFVADLTYFLGYRRSLWYRAAVVILFLYAITTLSIPFIVIAGLLLVFVYWLFWLAKRSGYVTFIPKIDVALSAPEQPLAKEERLQVRATGHFSVINRERYLVQKTADFWRVGVGDHIMMVSNGANSYLYQFIKPQEILQISAGELYFGSEGNLAIEVVFRTDWAPGVEMEDIAYYVGSGSSGRPLPKRTVYIMCDDQTDLEKVWHSLTKLG
jgi:hypothetical protein